MLIWRAGDDLFAIRKGSCARIGPSGVVSEWYEWRSFSDEDDLWTWEAVVENGRLLMRTTVEKGNDPLRVYEEKVLAEGLTIERSDAAEAFVTRALAQDEKAAKNVTRERAAAAAVRVDVVPGARDDLGLGADIELAQSVLREFLAKDGDALVRTLLGFLLPLAEAKPNAAIANAFARACLAACYSYTKLATLPAERSASLHPVLAARLVALAVEFEKDADYATYSDSHGREARGWNTAKALREAAVMLGHPT